MKAVPRHLLVLGGGPVGVEMAQAVQFGGDVAVVEGADHLLPREPAPLGEALARNHSAFHGKRCFRFRVLCERLG